MKSESTHLRRGNLVKICFEHKPGWFFATVTDIFIDGTIETDTTEFNKKYYWDGVELTEELLIKFGFKIDPEDHWSMILALGENTNLYLSSSFTKMHIPVFDSQKLSTGINLNYVHQLQNLYFALTGEEITQKI